jgi:hypothetical protein
MSVIGVKSGKYLLVSSISQFVAETERHCLYEEYFNGDGAVVSYLNNAGRTKETNHGSLS